MIGSVKEFNSFTTLEHTLETSITLVDALLDRLPEEPDQIEDPETWIKDNFYDFLYYLKSVSAMMEGAYSTVLAKEVLEFIKAK